MGENEQILWELLLNRPIDAIITTKTAVPTATATATTTAPPPQPAVPTAAATNNIQFLIITSRIRSTTECSNRNRLQLDNKTLLEHTALLLKRLHSRHDELLIPWIET